MFAMNKKSNLSHLSLLKTHVLPKFSDFKNSISLRLNNFFLDVLNLGKFLIKQEFLYISKFIINIQNGFELQGDKGVKPPRKLFFTLAYAPVKLFR